MAVQIRVRPIIRGKDAERLLNRRSLVEKALKARAKKTIEKYYRV